MARSRDQHRAIRKSDDHALAKGSHGRVFSHFARLFVEDAKDDVQRLAFGILLAPAGQALRHGIEKGDARLRVGGDHCIADARQRRAKPFAFLLQRGVRQHQLGGSLLDAQLQLLIRPLQFGFGEAAGGDFAFQFLGTAHGQRSGHDRHDNGCPRDERREELDQAQKR